MAWLRMFKFGASRDCVLRVPKDGQVNVAHSFLECALELARHQPACLICSSAAIASTSSSERLLSSANELLRANFFGECPAFGRGDLRFLGTSTAGPPAPHQKVSDIVHKVTEHLYVCTCRSGALQLQTNQKPLVP